MNPVLTSWLAAQTQIHTWSAEFVQTRTLKALTQPLTATGRVWFAAPNQFRWELGIPVQTVAVRGPEELLILYPRLKRVERFQLSGNQLGPWRDALALLESGFPRSQSELQNQFTIISQTKPTAKTCEIVLEPKSTNARQMIPKIKIGFDTEVYALVSTELQFADGSSMRNEFKNPVLNPKLEAGLFQPQIPADYKVVEPLRKK